MKWRVLGYAIMSVGMLGIAVICVLPEGPGGFGRPLTIPLAITFVLIAVWNLVTVGRGSAYPEGPWRIFISLGSVLSGVGGLVLGEYGAAIVLLCMGVWGIAAPKLKSDVE